MLGRRRRQLQETSFAIDAVAGLLLLGLVFGFLLCFAAEWQAILQSLTGYPFRVNEVSHLVDRAWMLLLLPLCMLLALRLTGYYELDPQAPWTTLAKTSLRGTAAGVAATALLFFLLGIIEVNRSIVLLFGGVFFIYQVPKELLLRRWWLRHGRDRFNTLLVCGADEAVERVRALSGRRSGGVIVRGVCLDDPATAPPAVLRELWVDASDGYAALLARGQFELVLLGSGVRGETAHQVLAAAEEQGVDVWLFSSFPMPRRAAVVADDFAGHPVLVFKTASRYESRLALKRAVDLAGASLLVVLLSPLLLAIALGVKLGSPGPVLFRQERTGWRGRPFQILKFRSMVCDAESRHAGLAGANQLNGPVFKIQADPRVTRFGRWLRRTSLDELPQLLNVLRGEMSLVGPRPLPVYETRRLPAFGDYRRLSVLPGMTGLWQVSGRAGIVDFEEWVRLDLHYIDNWSLALDARILLKTVPAVIRGAGAH